MLGRSLDLALTHRGNNRRTGARLHAYVGYTHNRRTGARLHPTDAQAHGYTHPVWFRGERVGDERGVKA